MYVLLVYLTLFLGVVPMSIFLFRVKSKEKAFIPLLILFVLASTYEAIASFVLRINVLSWFQIYSLLEFLSIYYLFKKLLQKRPMVYIFLSLGLFIVIYLYSFEYCFNEGFSFLKAKGINRVFLTLFIIVSSFLWVKQIFEQKIILKLYEEPGFYFVMGLFMHYCITISLFILSNSIANSSLYFADYWLLNIISSLILRIVIIIGVWKMN